MIGRSVNRLRELRSENMRATHRPDRRPSAVDSAHAGFQGPARDEPSVKRMLDELSSAVAAQYWGDQRLSAARSALAEAEKEVGLATARAAGLPTGQRSAEVAEAAARVARAKADVHRRDVDEVSRVVFDELIVAANNGLGPVREFVAAFDAERLRNPSLGQPLSPLPGNQELIEELLRHAVRHPLSPGQRSVNDHD